MAEEFQSGICSSSWWNSMAFPVDAPQRPHQHVDSSSGGLLADSALQMMGFGLSSSDLNCPSTSITRGGEETDLSMSHVGLSLDSQHMMSSGDCAVTCEGNFPSFLVDEADHSHPPQPLFNDGYSNYQLASPDYHVNTHELIDNIPNSSPNKPPFLFKPILQYPTVLWNSPSGCSSSHSRPDLFSSQQSPYLPSPTEDNPNNCLRLSASKPKYNEEIRDSGSAVVKKRNSTVPEPAFKRSRVETPSPLPTFKVRKEKLGDRINALQQLVSPFGKTDTASVLHEAIGYIKFLHDQVSVLSTPYMKNGSAPIQHQQTNTAKWKDPEGPTGNLRNRGLCLVPISSTFPLSSEAAADFCTPTFGGTFR